MEQRLKALTAATAWVKNRDMSWGAEFGNFIRP